jgi:predicted ABC-type ATPase
MPNLFVIGGPNGAGKTTTHGKILSGERRVEAFVNADQIASRLRERDGAPADFEAGRLMLREVDSLARRKMDLAFESTLSSRSLRKRIELMRDAGYVFHLIYIWLPNADMAVARVAARVRAGGHSIPEAVIRRRYERSLANFFNLYRPFADSWLMLDNSDFPEPRAIAWRNVGGPVHIVRGGPWERIREKYEIDPFSKT